MAVATGRLALLVGLVAVLGSASVRADQWVLGGVSGIRWGDIVQVRAQVDDQSNPGSIQIRGFTPDENIITTLNWSYGKPNDVVSEGDAALWDNTAFQSADALRIVDGNGLSSTEDLFKRAGVDQDGRAFVFDQIGRAHV